MSITERLQDLKDMIISRKLGYVQVKNLEGIPESQKLSSCYCPVSQISRSSIYKEIDTDDYAAFAIKSMNRSNPQFKGLIFDPMPGPISDVKKVMQMYSNKYNLPIASLINSKIEVIEPTKNNAIAEKMRDMNQHS